MKSQLGYEIWCYTDIDAIRRDHFWVFLNKPSIVQKLIKETIVGGLALDGIINDVMLEFGVKFTKREKRCFGFLLKQVMNLSGYDLESKKDYPLKNKDIFTQSKKYRRINN